jgi:hypothetical protein
MYRNGGSFMGSYTLRINDGCNAVGKPETQFVGGFADLSFEKFLDRREEWLEMLDCPEMVSAPRARVVSLDGEGGRVGSKVA